ncbi:MAG: hypothetical protein J6M65_09720 [Eubacterium sp.]|nr:hypothetical protein [Eubacterium sp.]
MRERGRLIFIMDGDRGEDTESFIRRALEHEEIIKWAYILHDKDFYNERDMASRRYALSYQLADGYDWSEKYSSVEEYFEKEMKQPPFVGDMMRPQWVIFCTTDKSCRCETVATWFMVEPSLVQCVAYREDIADQIRKLTREDAASINFGRHQYRDEDVKANFDFRDYINRTKPLHPKLKKIRDIIIPSHLIE